MAEPHIGSAVVTLTIDKAQVAAEARAAIVPGVDAAAKEAGASLSASTAQARGGIQAMIADANKAADATRAASAAQRTEAASFAATLNQTNTAANTGTTRIRGLGAAATEVGGAFGGAAGEATRLGSVLAYGGIAGGAAIGVAKLAELGNSMNQTSLSAKELIDLAGKTGQEAASVFEVANQFGDPAAQLKQLTEEGAAGIGTILNMRDAAIAAGQDTSKFDTALEQFNATFNTTGDTVARGKDYIDQLGGSEAEAARQADELAAAAKRLETATNTQVGAASKLVTSQGSVVAAGNRVRETQEKVSNFWTSSTGKTASEVRSEARAVEDASQRIVDARQHIVDAEQKVADAREALAEAGKHELLDVADAQDAVDAAQRKVNASTPEERGPAQHALDDAKQKLEDAKKALEDAKPDAERALNDAVRNLSDAQRDEQRAVENLGDAQAKQAEQSKSAVKTQEDYQKAVDDANQALFDQAAAVAAQKDIQEELATGIKTGPVEAFGHLKEALNDIKDQLDPSGELAQRILYLLASMTPEGARQILQIATPSNNFRTSALGGHLQGGEPSWVGDKHGMANAELWVPDVPGTVVPTNPADVAAALSGRGGGPTVVHNHYNNVTVVARAEPAERAVRRELERYAVLAGR